MTTREEQRDHANSTVGNLPGKLQRVREACRRTCTCHGCGSCAEDAFARFCEVGFPTTHDEDWRFTNVSAIAQTPFRLARNGRARPSQQRTGAVPGCGRCLSAGVRERALCAELSLLGKLPDGVKVSSLAEEISNNPGAIEPHLGRYLDIQPRCLLRTEHGFPGRRGVCTHPPRPVVEQPIYLLFVSTGDDAPSMSHPRNLIVAEEDSQATVVEDYVSLDGGAVFSNTVTELVAGDTLCFRTT